MFVDFSGMTVPLVDRKTGEIRQAQIFVAVLGASNYTYAEALASQGLADWIGARVRAFGFLGGVPEVLVPDNLASGVTKPCRYEPDINPTYADMAAHYGLAVVPARVRKPKDKAKVEAGVLLVERWVLARLRNQVFCSLAELNRSIGELVAALNLRPFKKLPGCRRSAFESLDRPALQPLPATPTSLPSGSRSRSTSTTMWKSKGITTQYPTPWSAASLTCATRRTRWRRSTKGSAWPATRKSTCAGGTPRWMPTCRHTTNSPSGRPNAWPGGRKRPAPPRRGWSPPSCGAAATPSRATDPAWASCDWASAMARPAWKLLAKGPCRSTR